MIIDARTPPQNAIINTEVCIVGAGAAGITLAREFIGSPFRVCLLESGGLEFDQETQSLYKGENVGQSYLPLDRCRLRYFGGTTNHWGGYCRPLDEIDFEARDWIPYSGWPFDKSHLIPFYERAQAICQLEPFVYDVEAWETKDTPRLRFAGNRVISKIFQIVPTRFGKVYREEIARADNISTYLYANVVDIETTHNAKDVTRVRVATLQGNKFWVSAKLFILAAGGIENARLLLLSNKQQSVGLGNQNDLVGRFFMEHPEFKTGLFLPSNSEIQTGLYFPHTVNKRLVQGRITAAWTFTLETMRDKKLLNSTSELEEVLIENQRAFLLLDTFLRRSTKATCLMIS